MRRSYRQCVLGMSSTALCNAGERDTAYVEPLTEVVLHALLQAVLQATEQATKGSGKQARQNGLLPPQYCESVYRSLRRPTRTIEVWSEHKIDTDCPVFAVLVGSECTLRMRVHSSKCLESVCMNAKAP